MQRYTFYLYLETALHVSGGTSTHHKERMQLYLQLLVFVRPLLIPAALPLQQQVSVEQFPEINKLCKAASCWIYILEYIYEERAHKRYIIYFYIIGAERKVVV